MNKYSVVTIIAIIVIVIPFAYSGLSILGAQQLEYRWHVPGEFSFFTMSNQGEIEFCNAIPFWTSFQKFEILMYYEEDFLGKYTVQPFTLNPSSSEVQEVTFTSEDISRAHHTFMIFDFGFDDGEIILDPNQFITVIKIDTSIIGVIPFSSTFQISGFEFDKNMNTDDLSCN